MTWGCTTRGRTPAMIRADQDRADHDRAAPSPPRQADPALRPALTAASEEGDGFADWMAHVDAGRIAVR